MKKKIIAFVLVVAVLTGLLAGCGNIVTRNDERVQAQVLATVNYKGDSLTVTYGQLIESFNSSGYIYVNYYGYSYEETLELLFTQLSNRKFLILYAKDEIAKTKGGAGKDFTYEQLLTNGEISNAIKSTNKDMESSLQSLIDSMREEDEANAGKTTYDGKTYSVNFVAGIDDADGDAPELDDVTSGETITLPANTFTSVSGLRFVGWSDGTDFYAAEASYVVGNGDVTFTGVWSVYPAARAVRSEIEKEEEEDDSYDVDDNTMAIIPKMIDETLDGSKFTSWKLNDDYKAQNPDSELLNDSYFPRALSSLKNTLQGNYRSYGYYYNTYLETAIISKLERSIKATATGTDEEIDAAVKAEYARIIQANKESFAFSSSAYETALGKSLSETIYNPKVGDGGTYGYVLNLLLKFSDDEFKNLNDMISSGNHSAATIKNYVEQIAENMKVWISNPNYTTEDGEEWYTHDVTENESGQYVCSVCEGIVDDGIDYNNIVSFDKDKKEIVVSCGIDAAHPYLPKKWPAYDDEANGIRGIVTQIRYLLDDITANVTDVAERNRLLTEAVKTLIYLVGDDSGMVSTDTNKNGYLISPEGASSTYIAEFTAQARNLIAQGAGNFTNSDDGTFEVLAYTTGSSGYGGLFIIMPTYVVFDEDIIAGTTYTDMGYDYVADRILPLDYVVDAELEAKEAGTGTIYGILKAKIIAARETDVYSDIINKVVADNAESVKKNEKVWKSLLKDLGLE